MAFAGGPENLLKNKNIKWGIRLVHGAAGSFGPAADMSQKVVKSNGKGYVFFINETNIKLVPGKTYEASVYFKTGSKSIKGKIMISMPGGKRTPYPVSAWAAPVANSAKADIIFKAGPDEKFLRLHLVLEGTGAVIVDRVTLKEVLPLNEKALVWNGSMLKRAWRPFGLYKKSASDDYLSAVVMPNGGFYNDAIDWSAAKIKAVEIAFRAFDEGGYVQLQWSATDGGKKYKGELTRSIPPDGAWNTLVFDVGRERNWKGTVKELRVSWHQLYAPCKVELKRVEALPLANIIPKARSAAAGQSLKVNMLKPRGEYSLQWVNGKNPGLSLEIYDYNKKQLKTVKLPARKNKIKFKSPEMAAYAMIKAHGKSTGFPLLKLEKLKPLNRPEYWWEANWIWSRNGTGPSDYVWFTKSFDLNTAPELAEMLFTGDDDVQVFVNGKLFHGNREWSVPTKADITKALHAGSNRIVVRVQNYEAWGGLLLELFAEDGKGQGTRICTDKSWLCHEGGKTQPSGIGSKVHVFGMPPVPPWGSLVHYSYIGPRPVPSGAVKKVYRLNKPVAVKLKLAKVRVAGAGKRAWIMINGKRFAPIYFDLPHYSSDPESKIFYLKNAVKSDARIIRTGFDMRKMWLGPDKFDFSKFDKAMNILLANAPDRYVLTVVSSYMPGWWLQKYPDEATKFYGNVKPNINNDFQSLGSKKWLVDISVAYRKLIEHIKRQPYASRIIGMCPADGSTWEWMWSHGRGHRGRTYSGYSVAAINSFREFLRKKYGDRELFKTIMPPTPKRLDSASVVNMLDPQRDQDLIDWFEYRNETVSDDIIHLCRTIKEASGNNWISGTYYGYLIMFSRMYFHLQDGGHLGINKIAKSPYVDFVFGPTMYHWRRLGMSDSPMQPSEAFTSHGKLVICELDYRVFPEPTDYERRNGKVDTVEQSAAMMNRGLAMILTRGLGGHYMELHERWFHEPVLLKMIKDQLELYRSLPVKPHGYIPVDVCVVSDEVSPLYVKNNMGDGIHVAMISELLKRIREAGFAYRHVLLTDLLSPGLLPAHKFYILTNTMMLSKRQRIELKERFKKENASVLFLYAPGAFYPDSGPAAANVDDILGMKTRMLKNKQTMMMKVDRNFGGMEVFCGTSTGPWFPLIGGYDMVLGRAPNGDVLAGGRRDGNRIIWFSTVPNLPPVLLRKLASRAGAWIYTNSDDPLHAGNDFLFLHTKTAGEKVFNLSKGLKAKAVIGPYRGTVDSGRKWQAESGITYGFLLEKK